MLIIAIVSMPAKFGGLYRALKFSSNLLFVDWVIFQLFR